MVSSLICATKKLSTILYSEFTIIEMTIGSAIDSISGNTGLSFIKFSFIDSFPTGSTSSYNIPIRKFPLKAENATQPPKRLCGEKMTESGKIHTEIYRVYYTGIFLKCQPAGVYLLSPPLLRSKTNLFTSTTARLTISRK